MPHVQIHTSLPKFRASYNPIYVYTEVTVHCPSSSGQQTPKMPDKNEMRSGYRSLARALAVLRSPNHQITKSNPRHPLLYPSSSFLSAKAGKNGLSCLGSNIIL